MSLRIGTILWNILYLGIIFIIIMLKNNVHGGTFFLLSIFITLPLLIKFTKKIDGEDNVENATFVIIIFILSLYIVFKYLFSLYTQNFLIFYIITILLFNIPLYLLFRKK